MATALTPMRWAGPLLGLVALLPTGWTSPGQARESPPPAYQMAAAPAGVPSPVLFAVALQESGALLRGHLIPWPWTLNVAGQSERYPTRSDACRRLRQILTRLPASRVDVGLGQINLGYQSQRYVAPCDLLDPYANLATAARILREQHLPNENWLLAIGRYHRPAGGDLAARYRRSVGLRLSQVLADAGAP